MKCSDCNGKGRILLLTSYVNCDKCKGKGEIQEVFPNDVNQLWWQVDLDGKTAAINAFKKTKMIVVDPPYDDIKDVMDAQQQQIMATLNGIKQLKVFCAKPRSTLLSSSGSDPRFSVS